MERVSLDALFFCLYEFYCVALFPLPHDGPWVGRMPVCFSSPT